MCVCIANTWIRLTAKGQRKMQQDLLVPQLRIFNVSLSNGQFHLISIFFSLLYLLTANAGHQGMLYNYNKILKCHKEMYSSSTFKVFFITATLIHGLLGCSDLRFIGCLQKNTFFPPIFFFFRFNGCMCLSRLRCDFKGFWQ